jgi:ketosteroid isomerase-like protein
MSLTRDLARNARVCKKRHVQTWPSRASPLRGCVLPAISVPQQKSQDAERILALERKWTEAYQHRDVSILSSLLAEDFAITVEDGSTYGKEGYIGHSADTSVHVEVAELSELRVRMHGNVAVVTGAYHEKGSSRSKRYEYRDRLTDVWMKVDGKWQVISSHYSVPFKP